MNYLKRSMKRVGFLLVSYFDLFLWKVPSFSSFGSCTGIDPIRDGSSARCEIPRVNKVDLLRSILQTFDMPVKDINKLSYSRLFL